MDDLVADQATARRCAEGFERAGFSVWWDQTLNAGEDYDKVTEMDALIAYLQGLGLALKQTR